MNKLKLSYAVDVGMLVFGVATAVTGILKLRAVALALESALASPLPMGLLNQIHDFCGTLFALLILAHIVLHVGWYAAVTKRFLGKN